MRIIGMLIWASISALTCGCASDGASRNDRAGQDVANASDAEPRDTRRNQTADRGDTPDWDAPGNGPMAPEPGFGAPDAFASLPAYRGGGESDGGSYAKDSGSRFLPVVEPVGQVAVESPPLGTPIYVAP